jgi:MoaA/NifB/PqqE/SkfB family radical SAM enzyme
MKTKQLALMGINFLLKNLPEKQASLVKKIYNMPFKNIINFFPTFGCAYKCPYCVIHNRDLKKRYPKECERDWEDWVKVFKKLPRSKIYISGGEPLSYPNLYKLINNIPKKHLIGISTNLSLPLDDFLKKIKRDVIIAVSFHPHMTDIESFKKQVLKLKKYGYSINVYVVAYPSLVSSLPKFKEEFEKIGANFNVDPFIDPKTVEIFKYTKEQLEILEKCRIKFQNHETMHGGFSKNELKECDAGSKYFAYMPNGDVYACLSGMYFEVNGLFMNNLFDGSFKSFPKSITCTRTCHSCDFDYSNVRKIKNNKNTISDIQ